MNVSIIIVNYNTKEITNNCIQSIFKNTKDISFEIILIDNASTDGSVDFFSKYSEITFISSSINLGFGRANNLGYTRAKGEYIFLLNSDTLLLNNAVKEFYIAMERLPKEVACIGTRLLSSDGVTENHSFGVFPSLASLMGSILKIYWPFFKKKLTLSRKKKQFEVDYITGADLFIRREIIEKHGLFDPDFFMYFEESNMQLRYCRAGYKRLIISSPKIIHLENGSDLGPKKYSFQSRKMYFESMFMYMRKRYGFIKYLLTRVVSLAYLPLILKSDYTCKERVKFIRLFFRLIHKTSEK